MRAVRRFFARLFGRTLSAVKGDGTAFARLARHFDAHDDARGKVAALRVSHDVAHGMLDRLETAAAEVHAEADKLEARLVAIAAKL